MRDGLQNSVVSLRELECGVHGYQLVAGASFVHQTIKDCTCHLSAMSVSASSRRAKRARTMAMGGAMGMGGAMPMGGFGGMMNPMMMGMPQHMMGMPQQPMGMPQQQMMMGMPQQPIGMPQQQMMMGMPQQPMGMPQQQMMMPQQMMGMPQQTSRQQQVQQNLMQQRMMVPAGQHFEDEDDLDDEDDLIDQGQGQKNMLYFSYFWLPSSVRRWVSWRCWWLASSGYTASGCHGPHSSCSCCSWSSRFNRLIVWFASVWRWWLCAGRSLCG